MDKPEDIYEALSAYLDGELSEAEARRIEQRLETDQALAKELRALRETRETLRRLPPMDAPADFVERVLERAERLKLLHAPDGQRGGRSRGLPRLAAAAVLLLVAVLGIGTVVSLWSVQSFQERMARRRYVVPPREQADGLAEAGGSAGRPTAQTATLAPTERRDAVGRGLAERDIRPSSGSFDRKPQPVEKARRLPDYTRLKEKMVASAGRLLGALSAAGRRLAGGWGGGVFPARPAGARMAGETIDVEMVAILTDDLALARRDVEAALLRNNLKPVLVSAGQVSGLPSDLAFAAGKARTFPQAQYLVFVEPQQLPRVQVDVVLAAAYRPHNAIRVLNTRAALPPDVARLQAAPPETLSVEDSKQVRLRRAETVRQDGTARAELRRAESDSAFKMDRRVKAARTAEFAGPGQGPEAPRTLWIGDSVEEQAERQEPDQAKGARASAETLPARAPAASRTKRPGRPSPLPQSGEFFSRAATTPGPQRNLLVWAQRRTRPIGVLPERSASTLPAADRLQPLLINLNVRARPPATAPAEPVPPEESKPAEPTNAPAAAPPQ